MPKSFAGDSSQTTFRPRQIAQDSSPETVRARCVCPGLYALGWGTQEISQTLQKQQKDSDLSAPRGRHTTPAGATPRAARSARAGPTNILGRRARGLPRGSLASSWLLSIEIEECVPIRAESVHCLSDCLFIIDFNVC